MSNLAPGDNGQRWNTEQEIYKGRKHNALGSFKFYTQITKNLCAKILVKPVVRNWQNETMKL